MDGMAEWEFKGVTSEYRGINCCFWMGYVKNKVKSSILC